MTNKWDCPHEWLLEKIERSGPTSLRTLSKRLAIKLSHDDIQELFQGEMSDDGYFDGTWELELLPTSRRGEEFIEAQMMLKEIASSATGIFVAKREEEA